MTRPPAIAAAMELVAGTYALISDMRRGGGSPEEGPASKGRARQPGGFDVTTTMHAHITATDRSTNGPADQNQCIGARGPSCAELPFRAHDGHVTMRRLHTGMRGRWGWWKLPGGWSELPTRCWAYCGSSLALSGPQTTCISESA